MVSINRWTQNNALEQTSLLQDGWRADGITVDGVEARLFSRPDSLPGLWKRAYLEREGSWYEIDLTVADSAQALVGEQAFAAVIGSLRWAPQTKGEG